MTLIEAVQSTIRRLHYSPRTEEAYLHWIRAFIRFHGGRQPRDMGALEMTAFLNHLAVQRRVSPSTSTQNQALCPLVFLYRRVLGLEMPGLEGLERARRPEHLPAVLSVGGAEGHTRRGAVGAHRQARDVLPAASQLRYPPPRGRH